jgi:hypothetical protein
MKIKTTISTRMIQTLSQGRKKLSPEARTLVCRYIESQSSRESFLFMNKSGEVDVYYSVFGLMLSYIFDLKIKPGLARRALAGCEIDRQDLIQYASYMRSSLLLDLWENKWWRLLFAHRKKALPAFSTFPNNDSHSPYSRFIRLSLMEDIRRRIDNKQEIADVLAPYRTAGGGYANSAGTDTASTNATAAALSVRGQLCGYEWSEELEYLYDLQHESGGFCATEQTPLPDILSTATALFVLRSYGVSPRIDPEPFIEAHWLESGGFAPTLAEDNSDIEYTFYGILALGTC